MLRAKGKSRCQGSLRVSRLYAWQIQCPSYALVLWLEAFFGGHVVLIQVRSRSRNSGNGRVSLAAKPRQKNTSRHQARCRQAVSCQNPGRKRQVSRIRRGGRAGRSWHESTESKGTVQPRPKSAYVS